MKQQKNKVNRELVKKVGKTIGVRLNLKLGGHSEEVKHMCEHWHGWPKVNAGSKLCGELSQSDLGEHK